MLFNTRRTASTSEDTCLLPARPEPAWFTPPKTPVHSGIRTVAHQWKHPAEQRVQGGSSSSSVHQCGAVIVGPAWLTRATTGK